MSSEYVNVNNSKLHFRITGKGDPLLLLHGWTQTAAFWEPYVNELARKFRVYALDLPGHGKTGVLPPGFSLRKASVDVEGFITQLGLTTVKAIGLSYGGLLLLEMTARNPALIEAMVLIAVSDRFNGKDRWKDTPSVEFRDLDPGFQDYLKKHHPFGDNQINALFNKDLDYAINLTPAKLQKIRTRLLIVNGDRDEVAGIDGALRIFKHVPGAALWIMPNTGHMAIDERNKTQFLETSEEFLLNP